MKIEKLFSDFGVIHLTEGHKHCRPGWVNMQCPFCTGNPGYHLGFCLQDGYFKCWRCGYHPVRKVLSRLLNKPPFEIGKLLEKYGGYSFSSELIVAKKKNVSCTLPDHCAPLSEKQREYLLGRGFCPDYLQKEWGLLGASPVSKLGKYDYRNRIIIPIFWGGQLVSFQGRFPFEVPLGRAKYKACPQEYEVREHQTILYGRQEKWKDSIYIVEGVADVWKLGPEYAAATFGIDFTLQQVREICNHFSRVVVLFDSDPQAVKQAQKLVWELRFRGVDADYFTLRTVKDPGSFTKRQAEIFRRRLHGTQKGYEV